MASASELWLIFDELLLNLVRHVVRREDQFLVALMMLGRLVPKLLANGGILASRLVLSCFLDRFCIFYSELHVAIDSSGSAGHVKRLGRCIVRIVVPFVGRDDDHLPGQTVDHIVVGVVVVLDLTFADRRPHIAVLLRSFEHVTAVALLIVATDQVERCARGPLLPNFVFVSADLLSQVGPIRVRLLLFPAVVVPLESALASALNIFLFFL